MRHLADSYAVLPEAHQLATELIGQCDEFRHLSLAQPAILYLLSQPQVFLHGTPAAACIVSNRVQAPQPMKGLAAFLLAQTFSDGDDPDFLVFFDAATWSVLDLERRERLVFHELSHLRQRLTDDGELRFTDDGRPVLALVPHDYEFFDAEVRRYGPIVCDLDTAAVAIAEGHREAQARKRPRRVA